MTWPHREQQAFPSNLPGAPSVPVDLSSFSEVLRRQAPELLPMNGSGTQHDLVGAGDALPHGTTIVALKFPGGVVMAGDRRSTQGNMIAGRDVQKVYITDDYTATGIAGTAAIAVEFARLYAVELEHYEKVEGVSLTFPGKVNRLATMVRGNLGAALQGFIALPLLAGYDLDDPDPRSGGAHRVVRRRRRLESRGRGLSVRRIGLDLRQVVDQEAVLAGRSMRIRRCGWRSRRSTTPPTTTPRPVARTWCAASTRPR